MITLEELTALAPEWIAKAMAHYDTIIYKLRLDNENLQIRHHDVTVRLREQQRKHDAAWASAHKQYTIAIGKAFAENEQLRGELVVVKEKLEFADESYLRLKQIHWLKQRPDADIESLTAEENDILKALGVDNQG